MLGIGGQRKPQPQPGQQQRGPMSPDQHEEIQNRFI